MKTLSYENNGETRTFHVPDQFAATIVELTEYGTFRRKERIPHLNITTPEDVDEPLQAGRTKDLGYLATVEATIKWEVVVTGAKDGAIAQEYAWYQFLQSLSDACCGAMKVTIK